MEFSSLCSEGGNINTDLQQKYKSKLRSASSQSEVKEVLVRWTNQSATTKSDSNYLYLKFSPLESSKHAFSWLVLLVANLHQSNNFLFTNVIILNAVTVQLWGKSAKTGVTFNIFPWLFANNCLHLNTETEQMDWLLPLQSRRWVTPIKVTGKTENRAKSWLLKEWCQLRHKVLSTKTFTENGKWKEFKVNYSLQQRVLFF